MGPRYRSGPAQERQPLGPLGQPVHEMIGRRLKSHYREIERQPLPDRFSELLKALDETEQLPPARKH